MTWFNKSKDNKNYKIKAISTYAWDRSISNLRKHRRVYDKNEINYLSASLEFYNKLFDEEDWKTTVTFKAFTLKGDKKTKEHCSSSKEYTVTKDRNILSYEYGWGNDKHGEYWDKGDYIWEIYIDDELVGSTEFRIEDVGIVTADNNPYFFVESLKTYEAPKGDIKEADRLYLKQFDKKEARYIMAELKFKTKLDYNWLCELFFNFYDDTGLLVGVSDTFNTITPDDGPDQLNIITAGWGKADGDM